MTDNSKPVSKCCNAEISAGGMQGMTRYYICSKCNQACDVKD